MFRSSTVFRCLAVFAFIGCAWLFMHQHKVGINNVGRFIIMREVQSTNFDKKSTVKAEQKVNATVASSKQDKQFDTVLYIVRTHPKNFKTKLAEGARTWMKEVSKPLLLVSSSTVMNNSHQLPNGIDKTQVLLSS